MRIFLSLVLALSALPAHAQLYKWTDANGVVHYSDRPQDGANAKVLQVRREAQPASPSDDWRKRELESRERRLHREEANQEADDTAARNAARAPYNPSMNRSNKPMSDEELCLRDAQQIAFSEKAKSLAFLRGGTTTVVSEEERQAIIRQRKENHALMCGPGQRTR